MQFTNMLNGKKKKKNLLTIQFIESILKMSFLQSHKEVQRV